MRKLDDGTINSFVGVSVTVRNTTSMLLLVLVPKLVPLTVMTIGSPVVRVFPEVGALVGEIVDTVGAL